MYLNEEKMKHSQNYDVIIKFNKRIRYSTGKKIHLNQV